MTMRNLKQGSEEWLKLRASHHTASEAPAMLNMSPHITRNELIRMKATSTAKEYSDFVQKQILDKGHEIEAAARPIAEELLGMDLYPLTGTAVIDGLNLLASYDGVTITEDDTWECKSLNKELEKSMIHGEIPDQYHPQLEQQLMITGNDTCLFMASDGIKEYHLRYRTNPELRERIIAGWKQFEKDVAAYEHKPEEIQPVAASIEQLPALNINIKGEVLSTNLDVYKETALEFISNINTELETDQDFADAEAMVKFCKNGESELEAAKKNALSQTSSIDQVLKTVDFIKEELRSKRLQLERLVKTRKTEIKESLLKSAELQI